ncbi:NADH-quinone oxidoreductase subunit C [Streptomyces roseolus]|uniref:NADH-quinone oxidoreductase subunit C n=1 Tax=Streptomyces roseolus TaxID=67358 RepID=UPI0036467D4E
MNRYDSLPEAVTDLFGDEAAAERAYDLLTVDVPVTDWLDALRTARDELGCTYFDWLSAVDEPGTGFRVCAHVVALGAGAPRRLLLRTTVPYGAATLPTAIGVYAGAAWHERETHEMFGVVFEGHPNLTPLLLPENFEGHPLRKDFVLAARVAKAWPGAKEPGESHDGGPKRRQMLPPGVPDPNEWGPLKGQLPPAPERPARGAAADRPRRTRTTAEGSATQDAPARRARTTADGSASGPAPEPGTAPARRTRSAAEGSASQAAPATPDAPEAPETPAAPRRTRSASQGSASRQTPAAGEAPAAASPPPRTRSSDAPWHHAVPAFDEPSTPPAPEGEPPAADPAPDAKPGTAPVPDAKAGSEPAQDAKPGTGPVSEAKAGSEPAPEAEPGTEPAQDAKPGSEPAPEGEPPAADPAPDAKPGTAPVPDAKPGPEPVPGASGTEPDSDPGPDAHPDPDTHPDPAGGDPRD